MPKNRLIYIGVLVVAASALLYLSYVFTNFVRPAVPYAAGVGVVLILAGVFMEIGKSKNVKGLAPGQTSAESVGETKL